MGVYESEPVGHRGMHWQQHQPERYVGPSAYDPSRDLSPNLPVDNKSSMGDVEHYAANNLTVGNNTSNSTAVTNNNNNSCSVSSCTYRHGPTTSNFDIGAQTDCMGYGGPRRNQSPVSFGRFEQKTIYSPRPVSPHLISQYDGGAKLNHGQSNKQQPQQHQQQQSPNYSFKSPTLACFKLKKPSSPPPPCAFSSAKFEDYKPNLEFGKYNNNNNNNNTSNNNKNNNEGQCHSEFHNFQPKVEQLPTPSTPPTPLSVSDESSDCAGCGRRISDRYYLSAVDRKWHAACLQCCQCHAALDGEITCFTRQGNIYCKKDYYRMFVMKRCARCQAAISSSELVMRARDFVFHVHCFTCTVCNTTLTKGDHFGLRDGAIFCRSHYDLSEPPESESQSVFSHYSSSSSFPSPEFPHPHPSPIPLPAPGPSPTETVLTSKVPFFNGSATAVVGVAAAPRQKGRPRKRKPKDLEAMTANLDLNDSYLDFGRGPGTPGGLSASGRSKRMRTSFKHHQLRTMKSYFSINHNPDAKDLKQLSQKTSLPKRVLQVWFQNARAKWRRMMVKQEGKSDKCSDSGGLSDLESFPSHSGGNAGTNMGMGPHSPPFVLSNSCSSPASLECS